jgi:predicted MPP superfamily phosphohydrolase
MTIDGQPSPSATIRTRSTFRSGSDTSGWILSGHTHGGQCKAPFLPPPLLPVRNRRYTQGEFRLSGNRSMYINRGVGHLLPVRINVRPEVTLFELRQA